MAAQNARTLESLISTAIGSQQFVVEQVELVDHPLLGKGLSHRHPTLAHATTSLGIIDQCDNAVRHRLDLTYFKKETPNTTGAPAAMLTRPAAIRSVLFALGIQADTDGNVSARGPPQLELDFPTSDGQWREQESKTAAA